MIARMMFVRAVVGTAIAWMLLAEVCGCRAPLASERTEALSAIEPQEQAKDGDATAQYNLGICYYNGDGVVDYETVNGEQLLVENNRHIYLEFNQLFTGYGWGVTSKGVNDFNGIDIIDIQIGENEKSVEKFVGTGEKTVTANKPIKLNTLFAEKDGNTIAIEDANIQVAVTDLTEDEVNITATLNKEGFQNWEDYELTFTGAGEVQITIQDYYFCTPTTITLTVEDRADEVKFENKFTGNFLYRVG
ncbi:MAG: SEL1-like repeat protein, partial [Kiritimatiellae bacterium]|nr:SEL1-like repeat protein [Kiritimatiellia bacterium]